MNLDLRDSPLADHRMQARFGVRNIKPFAFQLFMGACFELPFANPILFIRHSPDGSHEQDNIIVLYLIHERVAHIKFFHVTSREQIDCHA